MPAAFVYKPSPHGVCAVQAVAVVGPSENAPIPHAVHSVPLLPKKNPDLQFMHLRCPSTGHATPVACTPLSHMHVLSPPHSVSSLSVPTDFTTAPRAHFLWAAHVSVLVDDEDSDALKCPDSHFWHTGAANVVPAVLV